MHGCTHKHTQFAYNFGGSWSPWRLFTNPRIRIWPVMWLTLQLVVNHLTQGVHRTLIIKVSWFKIFNVDRSWCANKIKWNIWFSVRKPILRIRPILSRTKWKYRAGVFSQFEKLNPEEYINKASFSYWLGHKWHVLKFQFPILTFGYL